MITTRKRREGRRGLFGKPAVLLALAAALVLYLLPAGANPVWPEKTEGQAALKRYVERANGFLQAQGELPINSIFEIYPSFAVFGITDQPDMLTPESVEITAKLFADTINSLEIRVSYVPRFPQIAAAFLRALDPEGMTMADALLIPTERAKRAMNHPETSWEDEVEEMNGENPHVYYAYYPNQYRDHVNWIQMTIVFPMGGAWNGGDVLNGENATEAPKTYGENPDDYEGYQPVDEYTHYEFFTTPTPEPGTGEGYQF